MYAPDFAHIVSAVPLDGTCSDLAVRAKKRVTLPASGLSFAFAPISHPLLKPYCISPITQALEQAGLTYLPPAGKTRHIGPTGPGQGREMSIPYSWQTDVANVVIQYHRVRGDRKDGTSMKPEILKMDVLHEPDGTRLVWGIEGAPKIGGHKQIAYKALRQWVKSFGCEVNDLNIMAEQYLLASEAECNAFFAAHPETLQGGSSEIWFVKDGSKHGSRGVTVLPNSSAVRESFGPCPKQDIDAPPPPPPPMLTAKGRPVWQNPMDKVKQQSSEIDRSAVIVQHEIPPLLVNGGKKFSIRAYMIVVRVDPLLVVWAVNASYGEPCSQGSANSL